MYSFTISSEVLNSLLKRLLPLVGSEKSSIITLCYLDSALEVYYNTGIDRTDSRSIFHECLPVIDGHGQGKVSIDINQILNLKIPTFISEKKFPHCKSVQFDVSKAGINVIYNVIWSEGRTSKSTLKLPVLAELDTLEAYEALFTTYSKSLEVYTDDFLKGLSFTNFIKTDATSKDSNGCLLEMDSNSLSLVSTDSNVAVRYRCEVLENNLLELRIVVSIPVLNFVRNFIVGTSTFRISNHRNSLFIETESRKMLVPVMGRDYIIEDAVEFFQIHGKKIATLDLKALSSFVQVVVKKATDIYKRLILEFSDKGLNLRSEEDYVEDIPAVVESTSKINVNGDFLLSSVNKIQQIDALVGLYFLEQSQRITLTTEDEKVIFLIQGMSLD